MFDQQNVFQQSYQKLNDAQKQAVDQIDGTVMVIAGAGTGKTQILAVRIANILLQSQINPQNILCLTFTEAAVTAMRKRLISIIGSAAYQVKICTFHSFCNAIIKDNLELFIFKKDFDQLDDLEKFKLLREIVDQLGVSSTLRPKNDPSFYLNEIANTIRKLKQENISPEDFKKTIESFAQDQEIIAAKLQNFISLRQPSEAEFAEYEQTLNELTSHTDFSALTQRQLNYWLRITQNYHQEVTGQKKTDGPKRTIVKNIVKNLINDNQNNLPKQMELTKAYELYMLKMQEKGRYDYEDMIYFVTQELAHNQFLLRQYQEKYQYILVDEYQDTNSSQNQTVNLLGNFDRNPNLFVVGDDDQAIYRFQGASIENIVNFYSQYSENLKVITLTENYRSQQNILDSAGRLIANNQSRLASQQRSIDKNLVSRASGVSLSPLQLQIYQNSDEENSGIVKQIQQLLDSGVPAHEIAVLYRENKQANELSEALLKANIPFFNNAGENALEDFQIKNFIQLLRVIANPNQNEILALLLFLEFLNLPASQLLQLLQFYYSQGLERQNYSLFLFLKNTDLVTKSGIADPEKFTELMAKLIEWKQASVNQNLPSFFELVLKESGFLTYLEAQPNRLQTINKLKALFKDVKKYISVNREYTLEDYLEDLNLRNEHHLPINSPALFSDQQAVQLMTVHKAKGLEFQHVFIYQCSDKKWCSTTDRSKIRFPQGFLKTFISDQQEEAIEEARRLFYVALTRAKQQLYLTYAAFQEENNKTRENTQVRFLSELPEELIQQTNITIKDPEAALTEFKNYFEPASDEWYSTVSPLFLKKLAEKHVISPTSLNNYLTCPRKFLLSNLIRIPQAKSVQSAMGSAIHHALEVVIKQFHKTKIRPDLSLAILEYKNALRKEILNNREYQEREKIGIAILEKYLTAKLPTLSSETISEYNFQPEHLFLDQKIPITGKIDKIEPLGNERVRVTDFKTGKVENGLQKSKPGKDYWRQLVFYKILGDLSNKFRLSCHGTISQSAIEFLEEDRNGQLINHTLELNSADIDEVKQSIRFAHQQILQLNFDKLPAPTEDCDHCPFYQLCWKK